MTNGKKVPQETVEAMQLLYDEGKGLSISEISRRTGLSYGGVYPYTAGIGNPKTNGNGSKSKKPRDYKYVSIYHIKRVVYGGFPLVSFLIKDGLKKINRDQRWLANQLDIEEAAVSRWVSGKTSPRGRLQEKIFDLLNFEELTEEYLESLVGAKNNQVIEELQLVA